MEIKIEGKTIQLSDKLTIGQFRKLGAMPTEDQFSNPADLLNGDWIYNLLEIAGWKNINDSTLEELFTVINVPEFGEWIAGFFVDSKKVKTAP